MVMKPLGLFCLMFLLAFSDLTANIVQWHSYQFALINSATICEQKTKDCARSGSFQHKLQHRLFSTLMFAGFHNQFPLPTMPCPTDTPVSLFNQ